MIDLTNWLRMNTGATETYYGYANPGVLTTEGKWLIRRQIIESGDTVYQFADNDFQFDKIWENKELYFLAPSAVTISSSSVTNSEIILKFDLVDGVAKYFITVLDSSQNKVMPWSRQRIRSLNDLNMVIQINKHLSSASDYEIWIEAWNGVSSETLIVYVATT